MIANFTVSITVLFVSYIYIYINTLGHVMSYSDFYAIQVMKINSASVSKGFDEAAMAHNKKQKMKYECNETILNQRPTT